MLNRFVILGGESDLAYRYLFPALAGIHTTGQLPASMEIVGVGRGDWTTEQYRQHMSEELETFAGDIDRASRQAVIDALTYQKADVTSSDELGQAFRTDQPSLVYLALPPSIFPETIEALAQIGLPEESRIVIEKPFGEDQESARALNALLHGVFPEHAVFRIDHFLGQQTVQNVLGLRFANRIFEPLWSYHHIERVEIIWDETIALEGRAGYYDTSGALRDMIQNHLLQVLCFIAMEPPTGLSEHQIRDRKLDVLQSIPTPTIEMIRRQTYRARYTQGMIDGREIPSYVDEEGIDPNRETETLAEITLMIENWRWAGVPFTLRSGKALGEDRHMVNIYFHPVPHLAFGPASQPVQNVLRLNLEPDGVALDLNVNAPGNLFELNPVQLDLAFGKPAMNPYGNLILEVLEGNPTLFIRDDEAEEAWRIIDPIVAAWSSGEVPLDEYQAGTLPETGVTRQ